MVTPIESPILLFEVNSATANGIETEYTVEMIAQP